MITLLMSSGFDYHVSVVSTPDGYPSLSRMAGIVEHAASLVHQGKEVLIVTSGMCKEKFQLALTLW